MPLTEAQHACLERYDLWALGEFGLAKPRQGDVDATMYWYLQEAASERRREANRGTTDDPAGDRAPA